MAICCQIKLQIHTITKINGFKGFDGCSFPMALWLTVCWLVGPSVGRSLKQDTFPCPYRSICSCNNNYDDQARDGPALSCNYCWNTTDGSGRILRRKTKYLCPECQTNLCIGNY